MSRISYITISLNIVGLLIVQVLESWRPGSVAGLISIGGVLSWAILSTMVVVLLDRRT